MSNIYNKFIIHPNGTLINNWFEEEELRRRTGEGRSIPGKNFPKKTMDFDNPITDPNPRNNTFKRLIADEHSGLYDTTYTTYGNFAHPESKYKYTGKKEEQFEKFAEDKIAQQQTIKSDKRDNRLFDTTNSSTYVPQPMSNQKLGQRIMYTQDHKEIPQEHKDKLFMAEHKMGKYQRVISDKDADEYIDKNLPYYNDKELTFWSMNLEKGNMYRSATLGINPFGRSNSFTQPIQQTRGVKQFDGNLANDKVSKNIYLNEHADKFYQTFSDFKVNAQLQKEEMLPIAESKLIKELQKLGWVGLRQLKIYLRNIYKRKCDLIDKTEFKYYIRQYGIKELNDEDIDAIYNAFDKNKSNKINFIEFFNHLHSKYVSNERKEMIKTFSAKVNPNKDRFISANKLEKLLMMNYHHEVMKYIKSASQVKNEYLITWDNLKEDDLITEEHFMIYFCDVSICIGDDSEFRQCLYALGLRD